MSDDGPLGDRIAGAAFPSFYFADLDAARAFYEKVLGPATYAETENIVGLRLGDTWLTLFRAADGPHPGTGPRSTEFAIRVKSPGDVDRLHARLVALGARSYSAPSDTWMYHRMRFACVDDPFGIRIDVYCPLPDDPARPGPGAAAPT